MGSDDTASSRHRQPGYTSIAVAQTWSPGHLRSLASDVASSMRSDPTLDRLEIEEGGVSPWKDKTGQHGVEDRTGLSTEDLALRGSFSRSASSVACLTHPVVGRLLLSLQAMAGM